MQWESPQYLWLLCAAPLIIAAFWFSLQYRKKQIRNLGDSRLVEQMIPGYSSSRRWFKMVLVLLAFVCFVLAISNLRVGSKRHKAIASTSEVMICFDVSTSMLAEDIKPDRLTRARLQAASIIEALDGNKIGLIVFAGNSYVQMPLTVDTRAALMYLNTLDTKMISNQGTAIGDALQTALNAFEQGGSMDGRSRAVIVITDGETHDEEALDVAKKMAEQNIHLITVGAGTSKGAPIPVIGRGSRKDYKKDKEGNIVLSRLDEDMLKRIASAGNGIYLNLEAGKSVVQQIVKSVDALDKEQDAEFEYSEYNQHFQLFLLAGILLLLMEWIISDRGSLWIRKILNRENSNG